MFWAWIGKADTEAEQLALLEAFRDIDEGDDRAIAIAAAAFLEDHLAIALKARFHQDEKILNDMFRSSGPLGSFAAKINMAFLIGLCSKETCKEMHTIKDIRNEFAHKGLTRDFNSQRVRDLANNLTIGKSFKITIKKITKGDEAEPPIVLDRKPETTRDLYVRSCQMLLTFLMYHTSRSSPPPPNPPEHL
jgi:DNA-binding MltR family transcriptional regulator